jgi:uncharacterized protein (TIGR02246 family)
VPGGPAVVIDAIGPIKSTDPAQVKAEAEFRKVILAKDRAFYAGDTDRFLSFYADDVVSMQPGLPDVVGKEALAEGLEPFLANYEVAGTLKMKQITVSGDYATRQAEWQEVWTAKDGSGSFYQSGRCLLVWRKINGQWKVVTEFINYVEPPTDLPMDSK